MGRGSGLAARVPNRETGITTRAVPWNASSNELDDVTGLPEEVGIDDDLARAQQRVSIDVESRAYGKPTTVVSGFDGTTDLEALASTLKRALAVGGTVADGRIELQGEHGDRLRGALIDDGFRVEG